jgi:hypothetical protein
VRKLTVEYFSGKFIHKNSPLSEQFPKSNIKMEERDKIDTPNIQNKYIEIFLIAFEIFELRNKQNINTGFPFLIG